MFHYSPFLIFSKSKPGKCFIFNHNLIQTLLYFCCILISAFEYYPCSNKLIISFSKLQKQSFSTMISFTCTFSALRRFYKANKWSLFQGKDLSQIDDKKLVERILPAVQKAVRLMNSPGPPGPTGPPVIFYKVK